MKRAAFLLCAFFLILTVVACDFAGLSIDLGGGGGSSAAPTAASQPAALPVEVGIDSPSSGSSLQMGPVTIAYHALSNDGISVVELSIDGAAVSSISSPDASQKVVALKYTWNPVNPGGHNISVRAQSKTGAWSNIAISSVTIQGAPQQPTQQQPPTQQAPQATNTTAPTNTPQPTATPDKVTIINVKHNHDKFFYGNTSCGPTEITITASVTLPQDVFSVVLFNRFFDNEGGGTSNWDSGHAMSDKGNGNFSITLPSNVIANYHLYDYAFMNYQLVATDKMRNNLARTVVFKDIELDICP
jgi:hypothetical protein